MSEKVSPGKINGKVPAALVIGVDLLIGAVAYISAWYIRLSFELPFTVSLLPQESWEAVDHFWILLALSQVFFLYIFSLYDDIPGLRLREIVNYTFLSSAIQVFAVTSVFYFTNGIFPRSVLVLFGGFNFSLLVAWRFYLASCRSGRKRKLLLVAETRETAGEVLAKLFEFPLDEISIAGVVVSEFHGREDSISGVPVLGGIQDIEVIVEPGPD